MALIGGVEATVRGNQLLRRERVGSLWRRLWRRLWCRRRLCCSLCRCRCPFRSCFDHLVVKDHLLELRLLILLLLRRLRAVDGALIFHLFVLNGICHQLRLRTWLGQRGWRCSTRWRFWLCIKASVERTWIRSRRAGNRLLPARQRFRRDGLQQAHWGRSVTIAEADAP